MRRRILAIALLIAAAFFFEYSVRAFCPYPTNYTMRLRWLDNWSSRGYYGFNCSGFITNAHNEVYLNERQIYAGADGKLDLIYEAEDIKYVDESMLIPGDVAAFQGPAYKPFLGMGLHVAAYLGNGKWTDSDSRRGFVTQWSLSDKKSLEDPWFAGKVRLLRWHSKPKSRWTMHATGNNWFVDDGVLDVRLKDSFGNGRPM